MSTPTLDIRGLSTLGHRARVLAFIRYFRFAGRRHGTSFSARDVAVLKDLALSGCDYLEAAVEVVCMDANIDECCHSFRQVLSSPPSAPHGQHGDAEDRTAVDLGVEDASEAGSSSTSSDEEHEAKVGSLGSLPTAAGIQDDLASFAAMAGLDVLDVDTVLTILKGKPHGETGFSRDQFKEAMAVFAPKRDSDADMEAYNTRVDGLFTSLDVDSNGVVDFAELGAGLSVLCSGSSGDKITAAFKLFDLNGDGVITEEEMTTYLTSVYRVIFETTPEVAQAMGVTPERLAEVTAADAFDTADADDDGEITLAEFRAWYAATSSDGLKQLIESRDAAAGGVEDASSSSDTTSSDDSDEGEALSVDELLRLTSLAQLHVKEVLVIMRRVATHSADAGSSSLDRAALERAMDLLRRSSFSTEPEDVQARFARFVGKLFDAFAGGSGAVPLQEVVSGLSLLCSGTVTGRVWEAVLLFDIGGDGYVQPAELEKLVASFVRVAMLLEPKATRSALGTKRPRKFAQRATAEVFDHLSETAAEPLLAGFADLEAWFESPSQTAFYDAVLCLRGSE